MTKAYSVKRGAALLFTVMAAIGALAAYLVTNASADGRTLDAGFCSGLCIQVASQNGQATGTMETNQNSVLTLQPGTYWLTVTDNSNFHNIELRSCSGMAILCDWNSGGDEQELTPINNDGTPVITERVKLNLSHGTYRLFCDALARGSTTITHEMMGMHVDLVVGGVGQVSGL
jgi:hypothetical protein